MPCSNLISQNGFWTLKVSYSGLNTPQRFSKYHCSMSVQPYHTTGTCLSAQVIERSSRRKMSIVKNRPYLPSLPGFYWECGSACLNPKRTTGRFDGVHSVHTEMLGLFHATEGNPSCWPLFFIQIVAFGCKYAFLNLFLQVFNIFLFVCFYFDQTINWLELKHVRNV